MMMPESEIDADDYPKGPWGKARYLEDRIAELEGFKTLVPRSERRPINQHLHTLRGLLAWLDTRVGYVQPVSRICLELGEEEVETPTN